MKPTFILIISFLLFSDSNNIVGIYEIIDEINSDTLELKNNGTYIYKERGDSCWMWNDFTGKWEFKNNILTIFETQKYEESSSDLEEIFFETPNDSIEITVKSKLGEPISNFTIQYQTYLQWLKNYNGTTDKNGIVKFKKYGIEYIEHDELFLKFKYKVNNQEVSVRHSANQNSDRIIITLNFSPDSITNHFEHKFKFIEKRLISLQSERLTIGKEYKKL